MMLTPKEVYDLIRQGAADGGWQGFAIAVQQAYKSKLALEELSKVSQELGGH